MNENPFDIDREYSHLEDSIVSLYMIYGTPSDQLITSDEFVLFYNDIKEEFPNVTRQEIRNKILALRKTGRLPRLTGLAKRYSGRENRSHPIFEWISQYCREHDHHDLDELLFTRELSNMWQQYREQRQVLISRDDMWILLRQFRNRRRSDLSDE